MSDEAELPAPRPAALRRNAPPAAGDMASTWRWILVVGWALVIAALMVVAGAADVINRPTWWFGDHRDPEPFYVWLVPFIAPLAVISAALSGRRRLVELSAVATASTAVVGVLDLAEAPSSGIITLALAVAGGLLTVASVGGRLRTVG